MHTKVRIAPGGASTPTIALREALLAVAPDLFRPHQAGDKYAVLNISPRSNIEGHEREMTQHIWYDLAWGHDWVQRGDIDFDDTPAEVGHVEYAPAGELPPPPRIPHEIRNAEPAVTLDGISEDAIRLHGGPEKTLQVLQQQRQIAVANDRSADAYDWTAYAHQVAEKLRPLIKNPPKLDAGQRAHVAAARLMQAHQALANARASLTAKLANADTAGGWQADAAAQVRTLLPLIDPQPQTASA